MKVDQSKQKNVHMLSCRMLLGEQLITISKEEVINKLGTVTDEKEKKLIDKVCFNSLFFGTEYRLEEVTA